VRTFKRHKEFLNHFENLYKSLEEQKPDVIAITGDLTHQKSNISPEWLDVFGGFLRKISQISPVHVIPGNHDGVLNNMSRMDTLTPIINALADCDIHYYKHSGVYPVHIPGLYFDGDISLKNSKDNYFNFVVFSCFDDEIKWIKNKEQVPKTHEAVIDVGLFHGMVVGAELQNGQIVEECPYKLKQFLDITDYLLLGDIHKMQILDTNYRAAYAGSLIQQNYSESVDKGYLLWNIKSKTEHTIDFIKLPNLCPFYSIYLENNLLVPPDLKFQKNARIRIVSRGLTSAEKSKVSEDVTQFYTPSDIDYLEINNKEKQIVIGDGSSTIENLEDTIVQEKLIKDFLAPYNLSEEKLGEILDLNKKYETKESEDTIRNVQYVLEKMSFSNLFSYGEGNEFDFSERKGIIGIFGNNGAGKSSLAVDILNYTIFNRISKKGVVKNDLLINENKEDCGSSIQIKVGNDRYIISRATHVYLKTGKKVGDPVYQGKTDVDFKVIHADGSEQDFNGEQRDVTDTAIRKIFGSPDDFMATSVAPQWQLLTFIDAGGTERLKLIGRYFDIDVFDKKHKMAKEDCKQIKTSIKYLEDKKIELSLQEYREELEKIKKEIVLGKVKKETIEKNFDLVKAKMDKTEKSKEDFSDKTTSLEYQEEALIEKIAYIDSIINNKMSYVCTKNSDCCLLKDVEINKKKKESLKILLDDINLQQEINASNHAVFIEKNKLTEEEKLIQKLERDSDFIVEELYSLNKKEGSLKAQIERNEKDLAELNKLKKEYEIYDYFLLAHSKDGISKQIISKNLGIINSQIKKILSNGVNFDIELVSGDDGKAVEIFFKHERGKPRKIELLSGMEKSISALVIRAALIATTTLPKSNIFVLDEPFGSLDVEYKDSVAKILVHLKEYFDTVYIITHDEYFKDIVDDFVEVARDNEGYSRILE
jgi:DNA repair exonuclease SbcCD ATPase subunit/DNA repair exonuclease SbcCD nuclease subunit